MRLDLKDLTFNIPIRYDTEHRIQNINLIVDYIQSHFDTNIIVMEESSTPRFDYLRNKVNYIHKHSNEQHLHRTKCLNEMSKVSKTPYIANYDADVLFRVQQYIDAINILRNSQADLVFPYAGRFMECNRDRFFNRINESKSVEWINESDLHCNHPQSVGGAIFWNKSKFVSIGMENENFKSWGWEDGERFVRATKLGLRPARTFGILYHMDHQRLADSTQNNPHYQNNINEFSKVQHMSPAELNNYIKTWEWR
jgi:predicted glycosyltransferase involved in capsule biosynthesis